MSEPKIHKLERDAATPLVQRRAQKFGTCQHLYVDVDEVLRRVECRSCGEILDPIQVLLDLARRYVERDYRYQAIQEFEAREAEKREKQRQRRDIKRTPPDRGARGDHETEMGGE